MRCMDHISAEDWIAGTAAALRKRIQDEGVNDVDLEQVAVEMIEMREYNALPPDAAAAAWHHDNV